MESLKKSAVQEAIAAFLQAKYDEKSATSQKKLAEAKEKKDFATITELEEKLAEIREKFSLDSWMEHAADKMADGLNFGTHISKGIHPDSKGDNIVFQSASPLPEGLVASQLLEAPELDANGNAAYLPLAAFFEMVVVKERDIRMRHLILQNHPALEGVFASDPALSAQYQKKFHLCLSGEKSTAKTSARNKQFFWPQEQEGSEPSGYTCLIPLYPSALTHQFYKCLNSLRYSEENKQARENRYKTTATQKEYISLSNIAGIRLGGTKPQNISQLVSKRGGRNVLLPSLPPKFTARKVFHIAHTQKSFFNKRLNYHCKTEIQHLFTIVKIDYNNVSIRDGRKAILDSLLNEILLVATTIQNENSPGWTKELQGLHYSERLWLDPGRTVLEGEEEFAADRLAGDWRRDIEIRFGNWLNTLLKKEFQQIKYEFGESEQREWEREMNDMIRQAQRKGLGVFL